MLCGEGRVGAWHKLGTKRAQPGQKKPHPKEATTFTFRHIPFISISISIYKPDSHTPHTALNSTWLARLALLLRHILAYPAASTTPFPPLHSVTFLCAFLIWSPCRSPARSLFHSLLSWAPKMRRQQLQQLQHVHGTHPFYFENATLNCQLPLAPRPPLSLGGVSQSIAVWHAISKCNLLAQPTKLFTSPFSRDLHGYL